MKHTLKRTLALLLSLAMVLSVLPNGVLAAGETTAAPDADAVSSAQPAAPDRSAPVEPDLPQSSQFTTQPQGGTIAPGESHSFTWATDFTPVKLEIIARKTALMTGTVTDEVIDTLPVDATGYSLTYEQVYTLNAFCSKVQFCVRAYLAGAHDSNLFNINLIPYSFTKQPQSGSVTEGGGYKFTWKTNFSPSQIQIVARKTALWGGSTTDEVVDTLSGSAVSYTITYEKVSNLNLLASKVQYFVRADGVASNLFDIALVDKYFTTQPQDGTVYMNDDLTIAWRTNFTPTQIKLCREVSGSGSTAVFEPFATLSGTATSYDLSYTKAISFGTNARYQVWAYYNGSDSVKSDPFTVSAVDPSNFTFITQPQGGSANPDSGYTVNWSTNFTPIKIEVILYYIEPGSGSNVHLISECPGTATSYHFPYEQVKYWLSTNAASQRNFYIWAYFTDDRYVSSEEFNLSLIPRTFTTEPQNGNLPIGGVHTFSWDTNFTPEKIQISVFYNLPEDWHYNTPSGHTEILQVLNGYVKTTAIDYNTVWQYGSSPHEKTKYYVQAFYGSGAGDYISSQFTIAFTPYSVSLTQSAESLEPYESVTYNWSTNFTAKKFELVSAYHAGWGEYVDHQVVQTFPGGTGGEKTIDFNTVLHESYASWSGYRIRAYYGDGANDYVSSRIGYVGVTPFKFTGQPQGGTVTPRTPLVFSWATNYEPTCYEVLAYYVSQETNAYGFHDTSWETVAELNAGTHSYSLNYSTIAEYVRDSYVYVKLRAPDPSGAYVESDPIQVLVSGTVFSTQPQSSITLSEGGSPATLLWSLSAELSSQKLMLIPDGQTEPIVLKLLSRQDESCTVSFSELEAKYRELGLNAETGKLFIQAVSGGCTYNSISVTFTLNYKTSGTTGGLHWEYEKNYKRLNLTGSGDMADYSSVSSVPWSHWIPQIRSVNVGSGATGIGKNAFNGCAELRTVFLPGSLTKINQNAFAGCSQLANVWFSGSQMEYDALSIASGNTALNSAELHVTCIADGNFGDGLYWYLDLSEVLTISGSGAIPDYTSGSDTPWKDYRDNIVRIVLGSGVTAVGAYAFSGCTAATEFDASSASLTAVGNYTFSGCTKLKTVSGFNASSLTSMGIRVFQNCKALKSVSLSSGLTTIPNYTFSGCSALTTISIPAGVTSIGQYAFSGCSKLSLVSFSASAQLTRISARAFRNCTSLVRMNIPDTVTFIDQYAFSGCSKLSVLHLPASLSASGMGSYVFQNCTALTAVTLPDQLRTVGSYAFSGCTALKSITFNSGLTTIGSYAFDGCTGLNWELNLPASLKTINAGAFQNTQLRRVYLPSSLTSIKANAFSGCTTLNMVYYRGLRPQWEDLLLPNIESGNEPLLSAPRYYDGHYGTYNGMGWSCNGEGVLTVYSESVMEMPNMSTSSQPWAAFRQYIVRVNVRNELSSIGNYAFSGCTALKEVHIDNTVTKVNAYAFNNCTALTDVYYNGLESAWNNVTVATSGNSTFIGAVKHFHSSISDEFGSGLGWTMDADGTLHFYNMNWGSSDTLEIPDFDNPPDAPWYQYRDQIVSIVIDEDCCAKIGDYAFYGMVNLQSVQLSRMLIRVGEGAFYHCGYDLPNGQYLQVHYPSIEYDWNRIEIYADNEWLEDADITFGKAEGEIAETFLDWTVDNYGELCVFSHNGICDPTWPVKYSIPNYTDTSVPPPWGRYASVITRVKLENVLGIGAYAFADFQGYDGKYHLKEVELPNSLTTVGQCAFKSTELESIVFPDSVTSLGNAVLSSCKKLTSVTFPAGIDTISQGCCVNLTALLTVTIPEGVTTIKMGAFQGCTKLKTVNLPTTLQNVEASAFLYDSAVKDVYIDAYWYDVNITIAGNNGTLQTATWHYKEIGGNLSTGLHWELLPGGCLSVTGDGPMPDFAAGTEQPWGSVRKYISSVSIGEGVTNIGDYAFWCCTNLASFSLPESLTRIGNYAFHQCYALNNVELPGSLTVIATYGFSQCTGLTEIVLPDSVSTLGKNAFHLCTSLVSVKLPYNLTTVNMYTFMRCTSLQTVEIQENVTTVNIAAFGGCPDQMSVIYYGTQTQWNRITINKNNYTANGVTYNNNPLINAGKTFLGVALTKKNFPDDAFRSYLINGTSNDPIDVDGNGYLSISECNAVTRLYVNSMGIASIKGIEWFPNLITLECRYNDLTEIDLTSNLLLRNLDCNDNQLESLNLTGLSDLKHVNCSKNQIGSLNLDQDVKASLQYLECSYNALTELDVTGSWPNLTTLSCSDNAITQLEFGNLPKLNSLYCDNNELTALDTDGFPNLLILYVRGNHLTSLDISGLTNLEEVSCCRNRLSELALPPSIIGLECFGNPLTELDLSSTPLLLQVVKESTARYDYIAWYEYDYHHYLRMDLNVTLLGLPTQVEIWFVYKPNVVGNQNLSDVYVHAIGDDGRENAPFPGVKLEGKDMIPVVCDAGTGNISVCYAYRFTADNYFYHHVVFSSGTYGYMTTSLDYNNGVIESGGKLYKIYYADDFMYYDGNDNGQGTDVWPDSSKITHEATCTEAGTDSWFGLITLETKTRTIDPLGHDLTAGNVHAPTCTTEGWTEYHCSREGCDYVEYGDYTDPIGHNVGDWTVTVQPTCTEEGEKTRTCSICGESETVPVEALGHEWGEASYSFSAVTNPGDAMTCTAAVACTRCGETDSETASGVYDVMTEPTTEQTGLAFYSFAFEDPRFAGQVQLVELPMLPAEYVTVYVVDRSDAMNFSYRIWGANGDTGLTGIPITPKGIDMDGSYYYEFTVDVTGYGEGLVLSDTEDRQYPGENAGGLNIVQDAAGKGWVVYDLSVDYAASVSEDVWPEPGVVLQEPDCETAGVIQYTGLRTGVTATKPIAALGHLWGEASYTWSDDYAVCTASVSCARDASHILTETVNATYTVTLEPTDTEAGEAVWTAVFADEHFETQSKTVVLPPNPTLYELWVGGVQVTGANKADILSDGGKAAFDPSTNTLTLAADADVTAFHNNALIYASGMDLNIVPLGGTLTLVNSTQTIRYCIRNTEGNVTVNGNFTAQSVYVVEAAALTVTGDMNLTLTDAEKPSKQINCSGDIHICGNLSADCRNRYILYSGGNVIVDGDVIIHLSQSSGTNYPIYAVKDIILGGNINISCRDVAMYSQQGGITLGGETVICSEEEELALCVYAKNDIVAYGDLTIRANISGTSLNAASLKSYKGSIAVDGDLNVTNTGLGDGVRAYGDISVGGNVNVESGFCAVISTYGSISVDGDLRAVGRTDQAEKDLISCNGSAGLNVSGALILESGIRNNAVYAAKGMVRIDGKVEIRGSAATGIYAVNGGIRFNQANPDSWVCNVAAANEAMLAKQDIFLPTGVSVVLPKDGVIRSQDNYYRVLDADGAIAPHVVIRKPLPCPFTDVPSDAWYYDAVSWALENEVTTGTTETAFSPNQACTRAQIVTFLWRAAGCPESTVEELPFRDVKNSAYYYDAVRWAYEQGITTGVSQYTFGVSKKCTRAETVTFLWRAAGKPTPTLTETPFTDVPDGAWYKTPVLWAIENSITDGTSATTFSPNSVCTRAQIVTLLWRDSQIPETDAP